MTCTGICERLKAKKPTTGGRYSDGQRRCQHCEVFIKSDKERCPCCNIKFRTKPRNGENKRKFREDMEAKI